VRPCNHRIDQLAALYKVMQRGVQLVQILSPEAVASYAG
jgi:hypothetical protein